MIGFLTRPRLQAVDRRLKLVWQRAATPATDQLTWDELMKEVWRPVPGWESLYEVSDLGRVRSFDRPVVQLSRSGNPVTVVYKAKVLTPRPAGGRKVTETAIGWCL